VASGKHGGSCVSGSYTAFGFCNIQEVTGIYTNNFDLALNTKNGFPVFATVVEANHVSKKQDLFAAYKLTEEDKAEIEQLSKDPRIGQRVRSISQFLTDFVLLRIYQSILGLDEDLSSLRAQL
jgi:hypothetical protein